LIVNLVFGSVKGEASFTPAEMKEQKHKENRNLYKQSEIYRKALDLFVKKGYDATSMSMIAKALRMSKANLYYYCSSKENLLYQIHLDDLQRRFIPILEEAEKLPDPKDRIAFFLQKFTLMCTSSPASRVFVHEIRSLKKGHQNEIKSIWRRGYELVRGAIVELQHSGKARKFRESFLSFLGTGMVFWIVYWWDYSRQANAQELSDSLAQIFLKGLLYPANEQN
jgi:AcrR family transcriptional regulator